MLKEVMGEKKKRGYGVEDLIPKRLGCNKKGQIQGEM